MRLSNFILGNLDDILKEWEDFSETLAPLQDADKVELRDHATAILKVIAADLETPQAETQSIAKAQGIGPVESIETAA